MFNKKCSNCDKKIEKSHKFCPYCGHNLKKQDTEDFGFLGRDDMEDNFDPMSGGFGNIPMNKILKTAMKMTEKMMNDIQNQEMNKAQPKFKDAQDNSMNIQFFVNGKRVFPEKKTVQEPTKQIKIRNEITPEKTKEISQLPRKEPKTKMKRMGEKLIYEFAVPGVDDINNILISQLENSIEVKAISKTKVYSKNINVNLPILRYTLNSGNLILELQAE